MPTSAAASITQAAGQLAAHTGGPSPLWYATRATGVIALVLLTVTVALGVAGTARLDTAALPRVVRSGLHRNVSLLAVAFLVVHVVTAVVDPFARIGFVSIFVPFSSIYRPLWLGLGAVAFDLVLALVITSLIRTRLPYRTWRAIHWLAYLCWPVALWHGLGTGTDTRLSWLLLIDAICVLVVVAAACWRVRLAPVVPARAVAIMGAAAFVLATAVFVAIGPLQPHWARHASTPSRLVGLARGRAPATAVNPSGARAPAAHPRRPGVGE
jgi:DMSO/TMAO reductase YedYZ heme-binding membrane subunit